MKIEIGMLGLQWGYKTDTHLVREGEEEQENPRKLESIGELP